MKPERISPIAVAPQKANLDVLATNLRELILSARQTVARGVTNSAICALASISLPRNLTTTSNDRAALSSHPSNNGRFRPVAIGLMNCVAVSWSTSIIQPIFSEFASDGSDVQPSWHLLPLPFHVK